MNPTKRMKEGNDRKLLDHEARKLVKRFDALVEQTPTGELRNVLTEAVIVLQAYVKMA